MTSTKKLAALLAMTMVSPAAAQFKPSQRSAPFQGGFMECGIVSMKDVDGGKDSDPIYKIMISLELESDGSPRSMTVTHASMQGKYYSRHEQYTVNPELTHTPGKMEWFWSGTLARDRSLRMKGALMKNATGIHYYETLLKGSRVNMQMHALCHLAEGD